MAKTKSREIVQNQTLYQFDRDIRSESHRDWLNITEQCIQKSKTGTGAPITEPRISHYNPSNPLNGSAKWTREQHLEYRLSQKALTKHTK